MEIIKKWDAAMEEQHAVLGKIAAIQDTLGGQTTEIALAIEPILRKVAVVEAGLRGVREVQVADASQADDMSAHLFCVEGRVEEQGRGLESERMARASVEGEVAKLQGQLLRSKELWETTRREIGTEQVVRVGVEGEMGKLKTMVRDIQDVRIREAAQWTKTVDELRAQMRTEREDLVWDTEGLAHVVQGLVDSEEVCSNRVRAHGGLLKQLLKDVNSLRPGGAVPCERMEAGQSVMLEGLQSVDLNGRVGTVRRWDEAGGRYTVDLAGRGGLLVRPENLTVMPGT